MIDQPRPEKIGSKVIGMLASVAAPAVSSAGTAPAEPDKLVGLSPPTKVYRAYSRSIGLDTPRSPLFGTCV